MSSKIASIDKAQIFKDPECFNDYPIKNSITGDFFSEARFKHFLDTFNLLFEQVKGSLLRTKNFNHRYKDRCSKIIEVYHQKGLVKESYSCSSNVRQQLASVASLNERIDELHAKIKEKEALIKLKEKISKDATENKKMLKNEIQMSVDERMEKLSYILVSLEKCSKRDINSIPTTYDRLTEHERQLLEVLLHIIFLKDVPDNKFSAFATKTLNLMLDKDQLIAILRARRDTNFNDNTIRKIKNFTQKWSDDKFDKVVFKHIVKFMQCLVKKFNLKVMLESRYEKLEEVNQILIQADLDIAYYKNVIEDLKEELEDLLIKQKNSSDELKRKSRSISEDEARNEQVYKEVVKNLKKAEGKLFKSKVRMKNLFGDCLMLAVSISYLGLLIQEEKTSLRKNLAEILANEKGIEVSEYWHSDNENDNAKIFKKLVCDFGYPEIFHSLSHLYNDCVFSEFFFTLLFSPSTPIVFDSVGYCHDYLKKELFIDSPSSVFASEYLCEEKLMFGMKNLNRLFFLHDLTDYLSPIYGRIIDRPIFQRLTQEQVKLGVNAITKSTVTMNMITIFTSQLEY